MTKEEKIAFDFGKTFDVSNVPDGYPIAVCFDKRMDKLVSETRTEKGLKRNSKNMSAWYKGLQEATQ